MKTKLCTACKSKKPLDMFDRHSRTKDGKFKVCRICLNSMRRKKQHSVTATTQDNTRSKLLMFMELDSKHFLMTLP